MIGRLPKRLDALIGSAADCSLVLREKDQVLFDHRGAVSRRAASLIKVPLLALLARKADEGLDLNRLVAVDSPVAGGLLHKALSRSWSLDTLALLTASVSDNTACNALIDFLGMEEVNAFCRRAGLKNTVLRRKMLDVQAASFGLENETTACDLADFFAALCDRRLLSDLGRGHFWRWLSAQKNRTKLAAGVPVEDFDDLEPLFAHKTGELHGLEWDCGVFGYETDRPLIVSAALAHDGTGPGRQRAAAFFASLGTLIWQVWRERS